MKNLIIPIGKIKANNENYDFFKISPNKKRHVLEIGDFVIGVIENIPIEGFYIGGSDKEITSFNIVSQIDN
jgi:exosome complex RNA-binding protein Rrp4